MNRLFIISVIFLTASCSTGTLKTKNQVPEEKNAFSTNITGKGQEIVIDLTKGESFYYPLFAIWFEDMDGKYIQTLYVAKSVATGIFEYGKQENSKWSCQPALVYEAVIDLKYLKDSYKMNAVGHSHYSGKTGELFTDLSTLTTALQIADSIIVKVR